VAMAEVAKAGSDPYLLAGAESQKRLNKAHSLLNAFRKLASLHPGANTVERRPNISRGEFLEQYYSANRPVIIQGLMTSWRAMTLWTSQYLKSRVGDEQVEITAGRNADPNYELNSQKHRRKIRFADYVDMVYAGGATNDYYLVANNAFFQRPGTRPLLEDFTVFTELLEPASAGSQSFFWFGPAGTVTPLHHDGCNVLLAQVVGRKNFKLIPASQWQYVYNDSGVFTEVDCEKPDFERYPQFRNTTILDVTLEPGEVLFMPVGWWHHVRALDVSITISFTNFIFPNYYEWPVP
jgi:ribosomal protein L16 Arg81 hydroxylase